MPFNNFFKRILSCFSDLCHPRASWYPFFIQSYLFRTHRLDFQRFWLTCCSLFSFFVFFPPKVTLVSSDLELPSCRQPKRFFRAILWFALRFFSSCAPHSLFTLEFVLEPLWFWQTGLSVFIQSLASIETSAFAFDKFYICSCHAHCKIQQLS